MTSVTCGVCGAGASLDSFDNLTCNSCKATGTRSIDGSDFWEPSENWSKEGMEGEHKYGGQNGNDEEYDGAEDEVEVGEADEDSDGDGDGEDEGQPEGDFEIVFEARDYEHDGENQDAFPDPISIVVDGVGKLLPAVRWLRDLTSLRDGKPIGLDEAKAAMVAVAKEDKRIEVKDVPAEASNLVLTAANFANVLAREHHPNPPEEEGQNKDEAKKEAE